MFQKDAIFRPFGKNVDRPLDIPASLHETFDYRLLDMSVGEESEAARHYGFVSRRFSFAAIS